MFKVLWVKAEEGIITSYDIQLQGFSYICFVRKRIISSLCGQPSLPLVLPLAYSQYTKKQSVEWN